MAKKAKQSDNGGGSYLGAASVKDGSKGAATRAGSTPKDPGRLKRDAQQKKEEMKRVMEVNRKKQQKEPPASGRAEPFGEVLGKAILTGGRGYGVRGGTGFSKGRTKFQGAPDKEDGSINPPIRAKTPAKIDRTYIRKSKEVKSIKKVEKGPKKSRS